MGSCAMAGLPCHDSRHITSDMQSQHLVSVVKLCCFFLHCSKCRCAQVVLPRLM